MAVGCSTFPTKSQVCTHEFCPWLEFTDGLVAWGQGVTLPHTVISALLNYLAATLHINRCFCKYPKVGSTSKMVSKTNPAVEDNCMILKILHIFSENTVLTPAQCKSLEEFILSIPRSHNKSLLLLQDQALPFWMDKVRIAGVCATLFSTTTEILLTLLDWHCFLQSNETRPSLRTELQGGISFWKRTGGKKPCISLPSVTDRQDFPWWSFSKEGLEH